MAPAVTATACDPLRSRLPWSADSDYHRPTSDESPARACAARLRTVVRGWVALAEQMINDWVAEPHMARDELVRFLRTAAFDLFAREVLGTLP